MFLIAGDTSGPLGGPQKGGSDAFLHKYDAAGNRVWKRQLGTPYSDAACGVATDGSGNVAIAGLISHRSNTVGEFGDAFVAKHSGD